MSPINIVPIKMYLKYLNLSDKCLKTICSCISFKHLKAAEKYCELALKIIPKEHRKYYLIEFLNAIVNQKEKIINNMAKLN